MSAAPDLSGLTDDQLVELARLVAAEIGRRSAAVAMAAEAAVLDEAERARVARNAAEAEAARLRDEERRRVAAAAAAEVRAKAGVAPEPDPSERAWRRNKTLGLMVRASLGDGWQLTVWRRESDRRVYLDHDGSGRKIAYYVSGSDRHPPGALRTEGKLERSLRPELAAIGRHAAGYWRKHPSISCDEAAEAALDPLPLPDDWRAAYQQRTGSWPTI